MHGLVKRTGRWVARIRVRQAVFFITMISHKLASLIPISWNKSCHCNNNYMKKKMFPIVVLLKLFMIKINCQKRINENQWQYFKYQFFRAVDIYISANKIYYYDFDLTSPLIAAVCIYVRTPWNKYLWFVFFSLKLYYFNSLYCKKTMLYLILYNIIFYNDGGYL